MAAGCAPAATCHLPVPGPNRYELALLDACAGHRACRDLALQALVQVVADAADVLDLVHALERMSRAVIDDRLGLGGPDSGHRDPRGAPRQSTKRGSQACVSFRCVRGVDASRIVRARAVPSA